MSTRINHRYLPLLLQLLLALAACGWAVASEALESPQAARSAIGQFVSPQMKEPLENLISFSGTSDEPNWIAVNDGVMGGISRGASSINDGQMHFSGALSLENNGGFASVRTVDFRPDLSEAIAIILRVMGDGRDYQLRLASNARFRGDSVAYSANFSTTADQWIEVQIPITKLVPTFRGNVLNGPSIDLARIEHIGLLIADSRAGPFSLRVDWIKTKSGPKN
jgi:NADH dehydrogenase [ubiquinone] 1 alpha subcomplex assembly factor 1